MNTILPPQEQIIVFLNCDDNIFETFSSANLGGRSLKRFANPLLFFAEWEKSKFNLVAIVSQSEVLGIGGISLLETLVNKKNINVPFFLVSQQLSESTVRMTLKSGVADVFKLPIQKENLEIRIPFLIEKWNDLKHANTVLDFHKYKTPFIKRVFDIFFASLALLLLSPLLITVCILLKLESRGPIFYYALRVGSGYRTFKFYKFRSMYVNADKRLKDLKHLNQYAPAADEATTNKAEEEYLCDECKAAGTGCKFPIYSDTIQWCEKQYSESKKAKAGSAFFKLKDDPRITKVGKFIRNSSIDELPQLWNVIIGDMSIVGNRPLPLYEAEKLTTDKYAMRFMAPAGITGLWQVEKRGKGEMSEEERLMLDNKYAENHSFWYDIKLILRTIPALLQKESV
ncbi:sugar transferase [Sediminibacterium salmoneum]|uniref:sugar transferase n=1 Tax=Sediminibacterium salmoneum TaxID=426421 RepID=UPI00047ADC15|nr:sugar transferase [Sediminibacterium salmoneum]